MNFSDWVNAEIARGNSVVLPAGVFQVSASILVGPNRNPTIRGAGRDLTRLMVEGRCANGLFAHGTATLEDLTVDMSFVPSNAVLRLRNCTIRRCRVLGARISCILIEQPGSFEIDDLLIGSMAWTGSGDGYCLHVRGATTSGTKTINLVRPHDLEMRHMITLEDNVNDVSLTNCSTPSGATFATLDLHGKNEGKASTGSITATSCVGRFNVGNPTFTTGSNVTLINCNLNGRSVWLYQNSQVRRQNVSGWSLVDNSSGTGSVVDI